MTEYERGYLEGYEACKKAIRECITRAKPKIEQPLPVKTNTLEERQNKFYMDLSAFKNEYAEDLLYEFFLYWTEPNKSKTKMRFETERTWDLSRRLRTWKRNSKKFNQNGNTTDRKTNKERNIEKLMHDRAALRAKSQRSQGSLL